MSEMMTILRNYINKRGNKFYLISVTPWYMKDTVKCSWDE